MKRIEKAPASLWNWRRLAVIVLAMVLAVIGVSWGIASGNLSPAPGRNHAVIRSLPTPTVTPTPKLSKEYIYVGGRLIATEEPGACTFSLSAVALPSPAPATPASGQTFGFDVSTGPTCQWTATVADSFVTILQPSNGAGTGNGTVTFQVSANTGVDQRSATISVGGAVFTVVQAGSTSTPLCTPTLSPQTFPATANGGTSSFQVSIGPSCNWSAQVAANSFVTLIPPSSGVGPGTVSFQVAANNGPASRQQTISVEGQIFTINQPAASTCSLSLSSVAFLAPVNGAQSSFQVTPVSGNFSCAWTATLGPVTPQGNSFVTIQSGSGPGSGTVTFQVAANTGASRQQTLVVGDQTFVVRQPASPSFCSFSLPYVTTFAAPFAGGSSSFPFTANDQSCAWTASPGVPSPQGSSFVTITSPSTGTGSGTVSFQAAGNNTGAPRQQTIRVGNATFTISQAAACSFSINPPGMQLSSSAWANQSFQFTTGQSCNWTAQVIPQSNSFLTITSAGAGTGSGTVIFQVPANSGLMSRQQMINVGDSNFVFVQLGAPASASPPSNLTAVVNSAGAAKTITLSWTASGGTFDRYLIEKYQIGLSGFTPLNINPGLFPGATDSASGAAAYLYRVCAARGNPLICASSYSNTVLATTLPFSDEPLNSNGSLTGIKALHVQELRQAINVVRALAGLPEGVWSSSSLQSLVSPLRAQDIQELRDNLVPALYAMQISTPPFTDSQITTWLPIKAVHVQELRKAVNGYARQ